MTPLLTTSEVASFLAVSRRSIRLWAECGELRGIKIGRQWRFREVAVQKWIAERELDPKKYPVVFPAVAGKSGNNGIYGKQIPRF
jgi:excisionase family DNA binding protein